MVITVKPFYSGHLRFLKTISTTRRCPLHSRVFDFFEGKIVIDKNLTIFYINCDSLQLNFLKNIWIVLFLAFCSVSNFPINSFSIAFICLSPWISAKHFTTSRLSRASDAFTYLTSCSSSVISSPESLIKTVSSDCKTSKILFSRHSYRQFTGAGSTVGSNLIVSIEESMEKFDRCTDVKVEKCMN